MEVVYNTTCYNKHCSFRINDTSNVYHCGCVACPRRECGDVFIATDRTDSEED